MKFVVDMNLSPRWSDWLAARGHEASHWSDVGPRDATDSAILEWACAEGCVVLSHAQALRAAEADLEAGALVTIDAARHRVRLLPLPSLGREEE